MAKRSRLPKTPSRLIKLAMDDLNRVEKLKGYTIAMGSWHDVYRDEEGDPMSCHVCLAGSVMARTLGADKSMEADPENYDNDTKQRLHALDDFRTGDAENGFRRLGLDPEVGLTFDREITHYQFDKKAFKLGMRKMIRDLKKARF